MLKVVKNGLPATMLSMYTCVPANCTDKLQPMDLAVNTPFKDVMKKEFIAWYTDQVRTQLDRGIKIEEVNVDMRLSVVKPLSAKWIIKAVEELPPVKKKKGFERAGILEYVTLNFANCSDIYCHCTELSQTVVLSYHLPMFSRQHFPLNL